MRVSQITKEVLAAEMKKTIKVKAIGDSDIYVGYYNHLRRRGGDVFILRPVIRERIVKIEDPIAKRMVASKKKEKILITAEMQFSDRWMIKVNPSVPESLPKHFNQVGRGRKRLEIPGMTNKVGGDDKAALEQHDAGGESIDDSADIMTQKALEDAPDGGTTGGTVEENVI